MDFTIRQGKPKDMVAVLELITELAVFEKEPDAVEITVDDLVRDGFSEQPLFSTYVAYQGDEMVGMALYYYRYSTWKGKAIHLEDLVVKESKRNLGVGKELFDSVMKTAKEEGCKRVEWAVIDWNSNAVSFYKKKGAKLLDGWSICQMDEKGLQNF